MSRIVRDASELLHPTLRAFVTYWDRVRRERAMPCRADIDPIDIPPRILPHLVLVDAVPDMGNFRYRLVGTGIVERAGAELRGRLVTDSAADDPEAVRREMALVLRDGLPRHSVLGFTGGAEDFRAVERVLAPLSRSGEGADMLIGAAVFHRCPPGEVPGR